ncbi:MAG: transporter substrate-binding domain-containing protein [Gammaproteobacteria bacterium]|nr:transporter substrate-binding domain-containing protein [Gammaproteobacteria bacterium]
MKFSGIGHFGIEAIHKILTLSVSIAAIWVLLILLFVGGVVAAETRPDQGIIEWQKQTSTQNETNSLIKKQPNNDLLYRTVRVGVYENQPKIYIDENGVVSGIFAIILEEIAQLEKWKLIYVPCEWQECLEFLKSGRIDLMPDVAFSYERDEQFDFHEEEVVSSWSVVYANNKKQMSNISDLNGRRIAVLKGSIQQTVMEQMANGFSFNIAVSEAKSFEEAFTLVADGIVDAVASNHFYGNYYYREYGLVKTPIVFNPVSLYFATASDSNPDLLKAIDNNLRTMKSKPGSVYYSALVRWMEKPPKVIVPQYFIWIISGVGGGLVLAIVLILLLRWQVRIGTRNLVHANKMLGESEQKFRELFHQHAAVKLLIDPDDGSIVEANKAAEEFYGWSGEQLRRMRIQDINILTPEQVKTEMAKAANLRRIYFEFRHRLANGSIRDVAVFSSRIDIQGRPLLHSIIHDITERRNLEDRLQQAQKMEAVGRLAGGVAHDYNNMLGVILGYTELALEKTRPADPLHDDLKEIFNAARRSTELTRQLLAFSRKQTVHPKVLDLNETLKGMFKMLRRLLGEDIDLTWLPADGLWPIKIDPTQVDQILANLCVNARDAITDVGKVTIETSNITFDEAYCADNPGFLPGEFVLLAVSDDGCGMDKETMDHAFEPFFTTKSINKGTGLGLATVYGIVKQNDGFINIYSEPEIGTTFRLYFPRYAGKADTINTTIMSEIPQGQGEVVLLVEDDQAIRKMSGKMLENLGYQVLPANSPGEAMRLADEYAGGIHLLITDVIMPEMNGSDLASRLSALYPETKTLFMSGYTAEVIAHRGVLDDGVNFIQKPFSQKDLAAKVREVLDRK